MIFVIKVLLNVLDGDIINYNYSIVVFLKKELIVY